MQLQVAVVLDDQPVTTHKLQRGILSTSTSQKTNSEKLQLHVVAQFTTLSTTTTSIALVSDGRIAPIIIPMYYHNLLSGSYTKRALNKSLAMQEKVDLQSILIVAICLMFCYMV